MRRTAFDRSRLACAGVAALVASSACSESAPTPPPPPNVSSPDTAAMERIHALRARFPGVIEAPSTLRAREGEARDVIGVDLPSDAAGMVRVVDPASHVAAAFALEGARASARSDAAGYAFYAAAAPSGGDVVHRVSEAGVEDFVAFDRAPARETLRYRVDVRGVAGLRLVERALELLDEGGVPRLRVAPPSVADGAGHRVDASIALEGCAADTSPRAPWGRPVTRPGAETCALVVSWSGRGVVYPALVDPSWVSAKSMVVPRFEHSIAQLPNPAAAPADASTWLVTGGFDASGAVLTAAEIYEPLSRTFASTGRMQKARAAHTSTAIPASGGLVLVTGGAGTLLDPTPPEKLAIVSLSDSTSTETYDPSTGLFTLGPPMSTPRFHHTATVLPDNRILLVGGISDQVNQPTKAADLFTYDIAAPPGTIAPAAGAMQSARSGHAASLLHNGDVLVTGGIGTASFALLASEIFCASGASSTCSAGTSGRFVPTPGTQMTAARAFHTATVLANGAVLLAGGINATQAPITYWNNAELYANGSFQLQAIPMLDPRSFHTATQLSPPAILPVPGGTAVVEVVIAGGFDGTNDLASVEGYVPATGRIQPLATLPLQTARRHSVSALVNSGQSALAGHAPLIAGGVKGTIASSATEVLVKPLGEPCQAAGECLSGFCADGVCCDSACTQDCFSCAAANKDTDAGATGSGICGPTKAGKVLPTECVDEFEVHNECDGAGHSARNPTLSHDCKPGTCGANNLCSTFCDADPASNNKCSPKAWCDFSSQPDGGVDGGGTTDGGAPLGQCVLKAPVSTQCTTDDQCDTNHCVDGLCCDLPCTEQCQACDLPGFPGKCLPVGSPSSPEAPHPNAGGTSPRAACAGVTAGEKSGCAGACVGGDPTHCQYPTATASQKDPDCADVDGGASTLTTYPCDGTGANTTKAADCQGFRCASAHACSATCTADSDCIQDFVCLAGDAGPSTCQPLTGPLCDGKHTLRKPIAQGGNADCPNNYACPGLATECLTTCASVNDCVAPFVCNGKHVCVEPLAAPTLSFCSTRAPGESGRAPAAVIAAFAIAVASRRRRRVATKPAR